MPPEPQASTSGYKLRLLLECFILAAVLSFFVWTLWTEEIKCSLVKDAYACAAIGDRNFTDENYQPAKAQGYYLKALDIGGLTSPVSYNIHYQLGRTYFIDGMLLFALYYFDQALAENPKFLQAIYMHGLANSYLGRFDKGSEDFKKYLELNPNMWAAWNDLSWIYFKQGKFTESEETARTGLSYEPNNPWLNNAVGIALLNQGKKSEALAFFNKSLEGFKNMSEQEWGTAYPGNGPFTREDGLNQAIEAVNENIDSARPN